MDENTKKKRVKVSDYLHIGSVSFSRKDNIITCIMKVIFKPHSVVYPIYDDNNFRKKLKRRFPTISTEYNYSTIITAKAKCAPEDTFDETVGKKIAQIRAYMKAVQKTIDFLNFIDEEITIISGEIGFTANYLFNTVLLKEHNYLDSIICEKKE